MEMRECIRTRRSVRKFTEKELDREILSEIISDAAFAPSWKNSQTARWNMITDRKLIEEIASSATMGFEHNAGIINSCACLAVQSAVTGVCGYEPDGSFTTEKGDSWEMYDSGIAAQTFCLAAFDRGIGTVIMGIINYKRIAELLQLPENEKVTAAIAMGYAQSEPKCPPKKSAEEISRFF